MRHLFLILFFELFFLSAGAQIMSPSRDGSNDIFRSDSIGNNKTTTVTIDGKTVYTDYKLISLQNDTTFIDTTLNIKKNYKLNFIRKDNFDYMAFQNQGQTFNKLIYDFKGEKIFPSMGFNAKQRNYYGLNDIYYFHVPTPTSGVMYQKGLQQGQVLDVFLTANTSKQFNISIAYKGLRSLGKYRNSLSSHGNFTSTFNYNTKNKRYFVRGHIYTFDFFNQQYGGLTPVSIEYFETNDANYKIRSRLDVNFTDADNIFEGKRYYLEQSVAIFSNRIIAKKRKPKNVPINSIKTDSVAMDSISMLKNKMLNIANKKFDSIKKDSLLAITTKVAIDTTQIKKDSIVKTKFDNPFLEFRLGNTLMYETKQYSYSQKSANSIFGDAFNNEISDHTSYQKFDGQLYLQLNSAYLGSLKANLNYFNYNYYYNSILFYDNKTISNKLKGNAISFGGDWLKKFGNIHLNAKGSTILIGNINGSTLKASMMYKKDSLFSFKGYAEFTSKNPNFNTVLYQSTYKDYNWKNNFNNENITTIGAVFNADKWVTLQGNYTIINNYTYFNENSKPEQSSDLLTYFNVKLVKAISYKKLTLDNTISYQKVTTGSVFFRVPELITRNTLYFSSYLFKGKPLYLQTGVTFSYFSKFKMNAFNPLISEFHIQNTDNIGGYPVLDYFLNFQVRRTRFYFKLENFTANFTGRNYYSAPNYPYRDLTFRFGLVWNWFI